jgi:hypothetical protein
MGCQRYLGMFVFPTPFTLLYNNEILIGEKECYVEVQKYSTDMRGFPEWQKC